MDNVIAAVVVAEHDTLARLDSLRKRMTATMRQKTVEPERLVLADWYEERGYSAAERAKRRGSRRYG